MWRYKLPILAAFIALGAVVWRAPATAAFPEPGDVVTKENMAQCMDLLSPSAQWMLKHEMKMKVVPYRKYEWPKAYREATEKYAGQVKISEDGREIYNYVAGCPFPEIDVNDPLAGFKVKWNHEFFPDFTDNVG